MTRALLALCGTLLVSASFAADYVILDGTGDRTEFEPALERLAKHRGAKVVKFAPDDLAPVLRRLKELRPRYVALVLPPESIELDFQYRFLKLATQVDSDPFVDFSYGYITGATGADALGLVEAGIRADAEPRPFRRGTLAGGGKASTFGAGSYPLRSTTIPSVRGVVKGHGEEHDREFVAAFLPKLDDCGVIEFVGHGMPRFVSGGPDAKDLEGWKLDAPVILSVPCFTGVTRVWYEDDWSAGVVRRRTIAAEESFALRVIAAGPCGYTAYLCGRPAGPELYTDLLRLVVDGMSTGDARRRDYDKVALGFLGFGDDGIELPALAEESKLSRARDLVRDVMVEGGAGGVLYGDPAVVPFTPRPDQDPLHVTQEAVDEGLAVTFTCRRGSFWSLCADQTARFDGTMALRAYARVPLGDLAIEEVDVDRCQLGDRHVQHRLIWAVEEDQGERWLQLKVMFSRKDAEAPGDLALRVVVKRAAEGPGELRGGEPVEPERGGSRGTRRPARDLGSTEIDDDLATAATRYEVPRGALKAALVATAATLGRGSVPAEKALAALRAKGADGFRATCALILVGHTHYRTWELLKVTHEKGLEALLIELAEEELPGAAKWSVLQGLGATGADIARAYLLKRLAAEKDLGLFMAAAQGLAHLRERDAVPIVARRLIGSQGVESYLVNALGRIGGPEARAALERYVADERAQHPDAAREWLKRME